MKISFRQRLLAAAALVLMAISLLIPNELADLAASLGFKDALAEWATAVGAIALLVLFLVVWLQSRRMERFRRNHPGYRDFPNG